MNNINNSTKYRENPSDWITKKGQKILVPKYNWNKLQKSFWQFPVSKNSCSVHGAITAVANSFDIDYSEEDRKEIWEIAKTKGASDDWGWYFADAIKLVKDWTAKNKDYKFRYYSIRKEEFEDYAKQGFMIYGGIKVKKGSTRDKLKDGVIGDDVESYGDTKFGHAVCFGMIGDKFGFIDNYRDGKTLKTKVNEPVFTNLDKLIENGYFFNTGYILMTSELEDLQEGLRNRKEVLNRK